VPEDLCSVEEEDGKKEEEKPKEKCGTWAKDEAGQDVQFEEKDYITLEMVEKPYPNEHACRIMDPGGYDKFARKNCFMKHDGKCIDCIFGIKGSKSEMQAMRYPKDKWTSAAAKAHCKTHEGSFEAAKEAELEEGKDSQVVFLLGSLKEDFEKFMREVTNSNKEISEAIKLLKPSGADPATPIGQSPNSTVGDGKTASESILGEAFEQKNGKLKTDPAPISDAKPHAQYDLSGVISAVKDLKKSIDLLKGVKI